VPWAFDEEAVDVTRRFTRLKLSLMPYLAGLAEQASCTGVALMRPMVLEFPEDRGGYAVDTQFMLGDALCVSPVFRADGVAETYLPAGRWTHLLDGSLAEGPGWSTRTYGFDSLGVYVRPGTVLPVGAVDDSPEYAWAEGVTLRLFELPDGYERTVTVPGGTGRPGTFWVQRQGALITVDSSDAPAGWSVAVAGTGLTAATVGPGSITLDLADE
jgi:alpha-D-xyloside xylohydrolase